jgi:hypothetical protein
MNVWNRRIDIYSLRQGKLRNKEYKLSEEKVYVVERCGRKE